jgi:hypothetical protein
MLPVFADAAVAPMPPPATVKGKVEFVADYDGVIGGTGQVPNGRSPMPYLCVCAWDEDGGTIDFEYTEYPREYGDDDLLGCAATDACGDFTIPVATTDELPDIYLETKLRFRVVHEMGHVVDMRWRCDTKGDGHEDAVADVRDKEGRP